jgi:predicted DNA-binding transcriptional regulator AlpA
MSASPAYISRATLAGKLDCAESTVDEMVERGVLPKPYRLLPRVVRWAWDECDAAIKSLRGNANPDSASDPYMAGVQNVRINKSEEESQDHGVP